MSAEVGKGIFGRKGAGKSHELVRLAIQHLRAGRRVCVVMPQLDKDKVVKYLGDPGVADRLTVCGYKDLLKPNFFPNEELLTRLQLWRRFDIDYAADDPNPDSPRNLAPLDAPAWLDSIFRPGDVLIIDEAWRVMRTEDKCPAGLRTALHMARHWYGPADWRDPLQVAKFHSPEWFPGLGGPEWTDRKVVDYSGKLIRTDRIYTGGDGTEIVASNLIISSQRFQGLAKNLREQLDSSTLLVAVQTRYLPKTIQAMMSKKAQYTAFTFESEHVPTWVQMDAALTKKDKIWDGKETIDHVDELHELYTYNSGQAREDSADDKLDFKKSPAYKEMRRGGIILLLMFAAMIGLSMFASSKMESAGGFTGPRLGNATKVVGDGRNNPDGGKTGSAGSTTSPPPLKFAGSVGGYSLVKDGDSFVTVQSVGKLLEVNGRTVDVEKDALAASDFGGAHGRVGGGLEGRGSATQPGGQVGKQPGTAANGLPDVKGSFPSRYDPGHQ